MISPEILRRYPYFAGVREESLKEVAMISEERTVEAGTVLFYENAPADHLFIILEGEVDMQYVLGDGERRTVDTLVPGDLLVWSAIVKPFRTTAVSSAKTALRLVAIDATKLREMLEKDTQLGYQLMKGVAHALRDRLEGARVQLAAMG